jgi:hypothetical protein
LEVKSERTSLVHFLGRIWGSFWDFGADSERGANGFKHRGTEAQRVQESKRQSPRARRTPRKLKRSAKMMRGRGALFGGRAGGSVCGICIAGFGEHWQNASGTRRSVETRCACDVGRLGQVMLPELRCYNRWQGKRFWYVQEGSTNNEYVTKALSRRFCT